MTTGTDLLRLAEGHLGEKYVNVLVPKDNPHWYGLWDCTEFASWVVYQKMQALYGCDNNYGNPALADAYSGYWVRDARNGTVPATDQATANNTAGVVLIRKPPLPGKNYHEVNKRPQLLPTQPGPFVCPTPYPQTSPPRPPLAFPPCARPQLLLQ